MKSGLTIVEMAQQIERQSKLKQDYLLDTRRLQVEPFGSQLYLHTFDDHDDPLVEPLEINQIAHRQIGTHLKIPAAYYDRMLSDYPELLAENVNSWFQREPTQRMVRTLDGTVRAFLSNRYGSLLRPLSVGRGALLHAGGNIYHTSRVVTILEESEDCVRFETQNSHYHLSMSPFPLAAVSPLPVRLAACA